MREPRASGRDLNDTGGIAVGSNGLRLCILIPNARLAALRGTTAISIAARCPNIIGLFITIDGVRKACFNNLLALSNCVPPAEFAGEHLETMQKLPSWAACSAVPASETMSEKQHLDAEVKSVEKGSKASSRAESPIATLVRKDTPAVSVLSSVGS